MDNNFNVVTALCRQIIKDGASPAAIIQMERLRDSLKEDGNPRDAANLSKLITKAKNQFQLPVSKIELSSAPLLSGQLLTAGSKLPIDKETSAPLAEIITVEELSELKMPKLDGQLTMAITDLVKEWEHIDELKGLGITPAMSTMLFGVPGTGKTMLAHYIGKELGLPIVVAKLDGLLSSFLGTSARNISNLFDFAARYRCILLLDEFDAVGKARDDPREVGEIKRVVNTLLQCLDLRSKSGITIAITNHEQLLDSAVWRRFNARIEVPKPNELIRLEILKEYLYPLKLTDEEVSLLVWLTDNMTGADICDLTNTLKRSTVIKAKEGYSFIDSVKNYSLLSAHIDKRRVNEIAKNNQQEMAIHLKTEGVMNTAGLARLYKKDVRTINKWVSL